ncbi:MAG TPA: 50S ribosomal protein L11, partial [Methanocorpusculum sp.]|nr:50S ribosomal protein L11 [Methanocorpusculum sp.]
ALVMKEAGIEKGSGTPNTQAVGNLPLEAVIRIAKMKMESMLSYDLKNAVKEVMGTCVSVGVTIDGKTAKAAIAAVNAGEYDAQLA